MILVDADDRHHHAVVEHFRSVREPLGTVWPVLTETLFQVPDHPKARRAIWSFVERGALRIVPLAEDDVPRISELMEKYADLPMDLADAALVRVAERDRIRSVFTVDRRDFSVYRLLGGRKLKIVP